MEFEEKEAVEEMGVPTEYLPLLRLRSNEYGGRKIEHSPVKDASGEITVIVVLRWAHSRVDGNAYWDEVHVFSGEIHKETSWMWMTYAKSDGSGEKPRLNKILSVEKIPTGVEVTYLARSLAGPEERKLRFDL